MGFQGFSWAGVWGGPFGTLGILKSDDPNVVLYSSFPLFISPFLQFFWSAPLFLSHCEGLCVDSFIYPLVSLLVSFPMGLISSFGRIGSFLFPPFFPHGGSCISLIQFLVLVNSSLFGACGDVSILSAFFRMGRILCRNDVVALLGEVFSFLI